MTMISIFTAIWSRQSASLWPAILSSLSIFITGAGFFTFGLFFLVSAILDRSLDEVRTVVTLAGIAFSSGEWFKKGVTLHNRAKYEAAVICYDEVIALEPNFATAWNSMGNSLAALGRYDEALECYEKALETGSSKAMCTSRGMKFGRQFWNSEDTVAAWSNKGHTLAHLGRYEEAIQAYDAAIRIEPGDSLSWMSKGFAFRKSSRNKESLDCLKKSVEFLEKKQELSAALSGFLPSSPEQKRDRMLSALSWYGTGLVLKAEGRNSEAESAFSKALEYGFTEEKIKTAGRIFM